MKKLHLGCGYDIKEGYINHDIVDLPGVDQIWDLDKFPYPFQDNELDEIYSAHVLEHVTDLGKTMEEFTRICKPGAEIKVIVPYFSNPGTRADYTHKRGFTTATFKYFHPDFFYNHNAKIHIKAFRIHFFWNRKKFMASAPINWIPDFFINLFPSFYERFFAYIFPSAEIHYLLTVAK